ncbi:hypothetical protein AKJ16_DCAP07203 [Drosera capensis]
MLDHTDDCHRQKASSWQCLNGIMWCFKRHKIYSSFKEEVRRSNSGGMSDSWDVSPSASITLKSPPDLRDAAAVVGSAIKKVVG